MSVPLTQAPAVAISSEYRQRILALRRRRDWDGEGAEPITADACRAALAFIEQARVTEPGLPLPRPAPSVMGAVSLYWSHEQEGMLVEIASGNPAKISFHWEGPGGRYEDGVGHRDEVLSRVLAFHRRRQVSS